MIIAIGGSSNAGKSQLARLISEKYVGFNVAILCQDDFVYPRNELINIRDHIDWESLATIDFERLKTFVIEASATHDHVIVEGFLIFANKALNSLFDKCIFINIQESTFRERKEKDLRWGREPDWYIAHIWNRFLESGQAPIGKDVLYLDGEQAWPLESILNFLNK